jgi:hypothetical protein
MSPRQIVRTFAFVVLLWQGMSVAAIAQSGTGAISGTAEDATGAVLPGVTITLVNPGTVGGNQQVVTDARGAYQFNRLVPGTYGVKAELQGFQIALRENVVVNADVTARVDMRMEVGTTAETITVSGQAALLDTTTALNQTVLDHTVTVPGIVMNKYDVGGTEGFQQSNATVHGASQSDEGGFAIDGMEVGGGNGPGGAIVMYFPPASFEEINYQAGSAPAESAKGGIVYNMVTRTGTNAFHGGAKADGANSSMQWENLSPEFREAQRARIPSWVLAANPNAQPEQKIYFIYDTSSHVEGPIIRDKLWFTFSESLNKLNQPRVGSYNPDGSAFLDDNASQTWSYKISYQPKPSHQLHFYQLRVSKQQFHRTGNDTVAFAESRATVRQAPNTKFAEQLRWTGALSGRMLAEVGASMQDGPLMMVHQPEVKEGDVPRFDSVTQANTVAWPTYNTTPQYRAVLQPSLSIIAGRHDLKFGYQYMRSLNRPKAYAMSHYPAGLRAVFRNGVPDSVNTYNTPTDAPSWEFNNSFYAQDKFAVNRKLTLNYGLRVQRTVNYIPALCQVQTIFINARCFDEITLPKFLDATPRFAMIYDLFGNGRTAIKFSANRYLTGLASTFSNRVNPIRLTNDTRSWSDRNGDQIPQLDELGPSTGFGLGTSNRYNPDIKRPYANEFSVELEHQLPGPVVVSVAYYNRTIKRAFGSKNVAVPRESYTAIQVVERVTGTPVTVYNQNPALFGRIDTLWDNFPEVLDTRYNGVDVNFQKRLSNRWMVRGGMSFGRYTGDIHGTADLNNPNFQFREGVQSQNVPFAYKVFGLYELPYQISFSASGQYSAGFPEIDTLSVGRDTVTLTQVTQSVTVGPAGTHSLPNVGLLDLSARKRMRFGRVSATPGINLYNVFNSSTILQRTTSLGPAYGRVNQLLRGRMMKLGLDLDF